MDKKKFWENARENAWDFGSDIVGGVISNWFTDKLKADGTPVIGSNGKPVKVIDMKKVRTHAPYFVEDLADEAEFNALVLDLEVALAKSLQIWMVGLGDNQRADVILTTVQILEVRGGDDAKIEAARTKATEMLRQIASIPDDQQKTQRAIAFRLMKAREDQYLGAQLSLRARAALLAVMDDVTRLRAWMDFDATNREVIANALHVELQQRAAEGFFMQIVRGFQNALRFRF